VHESTPDGDVLVPQHAWDYIGFSIVTGKLELGLNNIEYVLASFDLAGDPAFPNLYLILVSFKVNFSS
jgi:hypothetical protein